MDQYLYEQAKGLLKNKEDIPKFDMLSLLSNNDALPFLIAECLNKGISVDTVRKLSCDNILFIDSRFEFDGLIYLIKHGHKGSLNALCNHYLSEKRFNKNRYKDLDVPNYRKNTQRILESLDFKNNKDIVYLISYIEVLTEKELKFLSDFSYLNDHDFKILYRLVIMNFKSNRHIDCVDMIRKLCAIMKSNNNDESSRIFLNISIDWYIDNNSPWYLNYTINFIYKYRNRLYLPESWKNRRGGKYPTSYRNFRFSDISNYAIKYMGLDEEEMLKMVCKENDMKLK